MGMAFFYMHLHCSMDSDFLSDRLVGGSFYRCLFWWSWQQREDEEANQTQPIFYCLPSPAYIFILVLPSASFNMLLNVCANFSSAF